MAVTIQPSWKGISPSDIACLKDLNSCGIKNQLTFNFFYIKLFKPFDWLQFLIDRGGHTMKEVVKIQNSAL